jgi:hypothetical protein
MMFRRGIIAILVAALLAVQLPSAALATQQDSENEKQRDGHSRNEQAVMQILPLLLGNDVQLRLVMMVIMMQSLTYQLFMAPGVKVTSQNRVGLGGLFGGIFAKVYTAEDFLKRLEVGSVYRAEDGTAAIALKGDLRLEDYRVIVFNGENQYDITGRPELRQIHPRVLGQLGAISMITQILNQSLEPAGVKALAELGQSSGVSSDLAQQYLTDIPLLRQLLIGKVYIGADNTLLIVIPPAIVLDR